MICPVDPFDWRRMLDWCERNADGIAVAACLIALAIITRIPDLWR